MSPLSFARFLPGLMANGPHDRVSSHILRCLEVVLSTGALHFGSALAPATVSICKMCTACITTVLLCCAWSHCTVCACAPSQSAPSAILGNPSSIFDPYSFLFSSPQSFQATKFGGYRPEKFFQVCANGAFDGYTIFRSPVAYGLEWSSSRPPSLQITPMTPLLPCANTLTLHCMCKHHHTQMFALHTTATAVFADLLQTFCPTIAYGSVGDIPTKISTNLHHTTLCFAVHLTPL